MYETIPWIKVWLFNDSSKLRPNHAINHDIWQQLKVATLFTLKPFRWEHFNWIQTFLNIFCEENRWNHEFWTCGLLVQLCLELFGTIIRLKERRGDSPWIMRVLGSIPVLNLKRTFTMIGSELGVGGHLFFVWHLVTTSNLWLLVRSPM